MEPGKRGTRAYFDVDDIKAGAARVTSLAARRASRCPYPAWAGSSPAPTRTATSSASGRRTSFAAARYGGDTLVDAIRWWETSMNHYLRTGECLRAPATH